MGRRRSPEELPDLPLILVHPLDLPGAGIEGMALLKEVSTEEGPLLWELLRAVLSWSHSRDGTYLGERSRLKAMERRFLLLDERPLGAAAGLITGYLGRRSAGIASRIATECVCIAEWARDRGFPATGGEFLRAAALAVPANPRYAFLVGHFHRAAERRLDAEHWFFRAYRVAVWTDDWTCQVLTLGAMADMLARGGAARRADRMVTRGIQIAKRRGNRKLKNLVLAKRAQLRKEGLLPRASGVAHPPGRSPIIEIDSALAVSRLRLPLEKGEQE